MDSYFLTDQAFHSDLLGALLLFGNFLWMPLVKTIFSIHCLSLKGLDFLHQLAERTEPKETQIFTKEKLHSSEVLRVAFSFNSHSAKCFRRKLNLLADVDSTKICVCTCGMYCKYHHRNRNKFRIKTTNSLRYHTLPDAGLNIFFKWGFFFSVLYSTLFHLPPLKFHCVEGCWDRTQDSCDYGTDCRTL